MQEHPLVLACLVASGPLWCVIAAATSWVIMDRFFIPLCYGTHFLVNVYFVSQFTSDVSSESDPEAPRSAQPAARGTASAEGEESEEVACVLEASPWDSAGELEWGSLPTQPTEASPGSACAQHAAPARPHAAPEAEESPVAQRRVHKDFLPGNMLRWGTKAGTQRSTRHVLGDELSERRLLGQWGSWGSSGFFTNETSRSPFSTDFPEGILDHRAIWPRNRHTSDIFDAVCKGGSK